jgi:hypothetical protein
MAVDDSEMANTAGESASTPPAKEPRENLAADQQAAGGPLIEVPYPKFLFRIRITGSTCEILRDVGTVLGRVLKELAKEAKANWEARTQHQAARVMHW